MRIRLLTITVPSPPCHLSLFRCFDMSTSTSRRMDAIIQSHYNGSRSASTLDRLPTEMRHMVMQELLEYKGCDTCNHSTYLDLEEAIRASLASENWFHDVDDILRRALAKYDFSNMLEDHVIPANTCKCDFHRRFACDGQYFNLLHQLTLIMESVLPKECAPWTASLLHEEMSAFLRAALPLVIRNEPFNHLLQPIALLGLRKREAAQEHDARQRAERELEATKRQLVDVREKYSQLLTGPNNPRLAAWRLTQENSRLQQEIRSLRRRSHGK